MIAAILAALVIAALYALAVYLAHPKRREYR